jgi:hypothetical protein
MRHQKVEGIGINDATYKVGTTCPFYRAWHSMLKRCYNPKMLAKNPTYAGCSVDPSWHLFSTFKEWMMNQDWVGKQLDKDLLVPGNKVYGPNTCLFVSHQVNGLLNTQPKLRGYLPIGVIKHGKKFKVNFKKNKKTVHIGVFDSIEEATHAYVLNKAAWIDQVASSEPCITTKRVLLNAALMLRKTLP